MVFVVIASFINTVYATDPDDATKKKIVTSQKYVDDLSATKQEKLSAQSGDYAVIYPNSNSNQTDGAVTARPIIDYIADSSYNNQLITAGAVKTALNSKQEKIDGSNALNGKILTYTGTVGQTGTKDVYDDTASFG